MNVNNNSNYADRQMQKPMQQMQQASPTQMMPMQQGMQASPTQMAPVERTPAPIVSTTPTTLESTYYTAGLLRNFIGQRMRVQFLIGTGGPLLDLTGTLIEVGASYIILQPTDTDDLVICDLYSIKFVTVFR